LGDEVWRREVPVSEFAASDAERFIAEGLGKTSVRVSGRVGYETFFTMVWAC